MVTLMKLLRTLEAQMPVARPSLILKQNVSTTL